MAPPVSSGNAGASLGLEQGENQQAPGEQANRYKYDPKAEAFRATNRAIRASHAGEAFPTKDLSVFACVFETGSSNIKLHHHGPSESRCHQRKFFSEPP
jgi:hypothetical protein